MHPITNIPLITHTGHKLTALEQAFIQCYLVSKNASQAIIDAGYKVSTPAQASSRASEVLSRPFVAEEISYLLEQQKSQKIADADEILRFYTSVMRGEVLDQFGIEASLDTRIKAANEMAKHKIEIPLRLKEKQSNNNIGSIQLNFIARKSDENEEN